jgi:photoactive yellow protein
MTMEYEALCAWCGLTLGYREVPHSHGICPVCRDAFLGIPLLAEHELMAMPFGVIELNDNGTILTYNKAEETISGMSARDVLGRNFFQDVAPCTSVKEFEGRFKTFISSDSGPENFNFVFRFPGRKTNVSITFVRSTKGTSLVLVKALTRAVPTT